MDVGPRPVRSFVHLCPPKDRPGATPNQIRASTTLPRASLPSRPKPWPVSTWTLGRLSFEASKRTLYLSATPRVRRLNHLLTKQAPGNHPGSHTPSRISDGLRLRILVLPSNGEGTGDSRSVTSLGGVILHLTGVCPALPSKHSFHLRLWLYRLLPGATRRRFQGVEHRSTPLPIAPSAFAVRYRLRPDLLARPCGLFG